jgi:hypothetical protein
MPLGTHELHPAYEGEGERAETEPVRQPALPASHQDGLYLGLIVLLSFILYAPRLGFYSDDWVFLELLHNADSGSLVDLIRGLYSGDRVIQQRPMQVLYLAGLYRLFGLNPAGYHFVNGGVLLANAVLFYAVLRRLGLHRLVALAVPLVYSLLPNYSSDRFWPAAFQAPLSITFYFLSLYCLLRAQGSPARRLAWLACSGLTVTGSVLAYEVTLPLFLLNPLLVWYASRRDSKRFIEEKGALSPWVLGAVTLIPLAAVTLFKLAVTVRVNVQINYLAHLLHIVGGAVRLNYVVYGLALPYIVWWILHNAADWRILLAALAVGGSTVAYLYRIAASGAGDKPQSQGFWLRLVSAGLLVFVLGYAVFIVSADITFESTSLGNRVGIAAAIGVALTFVGTAGLASTLAASLRVRAGLFSSLVALLAATGFLINNTLAAFWEEAYLRQQAVLTDMNRHLGEPPADGIVLLDGVCLEHRGAYLFTGERDLESVLSIFYPHQDFEARALSHKPKPEADGLIVHTHRERTLFPYGETLLIYNHEQGAVYPIRSAQEVDAYFARHPFDPDRDCPLGFAWGWNAQ